MMLESVATKTTIDVNFYKFVQVECNKQMNGNRAYNPMRVVESALVYSAIMNQDKNVPGIENNDIAEGINILNVLTKSRTPVSL